MKLPRLIRALAASLVAFGTLAPGARAADPVVSNVRASQRPGTNLVDILYDVADPDSDTVSVSLRVSSDDGATWAVPATSLAGDAGPGIAPGRNRRIAWDAGADWGGQFSDRMRFEVTATDLPTAGDYMVIDLSAGPEAASYPVSTLAAAPAGGWTDEYKTTKLVLRRIPAGTFTMGSPTGELGRDSDETQHQVTLTQDFYMGVFEVTQKQYERVMGTWPSYFSNAAYRDARPVEMVSWNDIRGGAWPWGVPGAATFLGKLRQRTGLPLDLPTEAQWEYACRAGTATALNSGKNLTSTSSCPNVAEVGRYYYNHPGGYSSSQGVDTAVGTAKAGSYLPNAWGLYDMHGNVWEWCLDWYGTYPGTVTDPEGAAAGSNRVLRGGSWLNYAGHCRSAGRGGYYPDYRISYVGFRVRSAPPVQ